MSTRANIKVTDQWGDTLWFYRHCDGYPEGVKETLTQFIDLVKKGTIRDNVGQAAGWLIVFGHNRYMADGLSQSAPSDKGILGWKVGAYEPTTGQHGDIEYLYHVDLDKKIVTGYEVSSVSGKIIPNPIVQWGNVGPKVFRDKNGKFRKPERHAYFDYASERQGKRPRHIVVTEESGDYLKGYYADPRPNEASGFRAFKKNKIENLRNELK